MTFTLLVVFALALGIAYANGANDVSKGVATLVGGGVANIRRAISWGTLCTGVGAVTGAFLARAMVQTFGKGLLHANVHATVAAAISTIAGAALWVALATHKGLPVSTTHAIVGSISGVASVTYGLGGVNWVGLGGKIALPLLLSPAVSLLLTSVLLRVFRSFASGETGDCVCLELASSVATVSGPELALRASVAPTVHVATCAASQHAVFGITINHLHWLTSGGTSFARGLNDAPKMVALVLGAAALVGAVSNPPLVYFIAVAVGMVAGSWLAGRKVTDVLAGEVTRMNDREGFIANLVTAVLVGPGAALGLPMSTTHVASGAIIGIAGRNGEMDRRTVRDMLMAWIITLPAAALLGIAVFLILRVAGLR
jgi:inorganic phosphate transporter, PiT family